MGSTSLGSIHGGRRRPTPVAPGTAELHRSSARSSGRQAKKKKKKVKATLQLVERVGEGWGRMGRDLWAVLWVSSWMLGLETGIDWKKALSLFADPQVKKC